jgi:type II secretion system (T2SS) protein M
MATALTGWRLPESVESQIEALTPRDRLLLVGLILFVVALGTGGFWYLLHHELQDKASRVRAAKETYEHVTALETQYKEADARFTSQKDRLEQYSKQPVSAWVEDLANKHELGTLLSAVSEKGTEQVGDITQTRYTVEIKRAPQEALFRFLRDLETSGFPARVDTANFKVVTVHGKDKAMDLTLEILVLSLGQAQ